MGIDVAVGNMKLSHICLNENASCELEVMEVCQIHVEVCHPRCVC